jgi:hypothetical protein
VFSVILILKTVVPMKRENTSLCATCKIYEIARLKYEEDESVFQPKSEQSWTWTVYLIIAAIAATLALIFSIAAFIKSGRECISVHASIDPRRPVGPRALVSPRRLVSPPGLVGPKGEPGPRGEVGPRGFVGFIGPGNQGIEEDPWRSGSEGPPRPSSSEGLPGLPGSQGRVGTQGTIGPATPMGIGGEPGDLGHPGSCP